MLILEKYRNYLYMDLRTRVIRVVQGRPVDNRLNFNVSGFGTLVLPAPLLLPGDRSGVSESARLLRAFLDERGMKTVRVVASLGQRGIITRNARVPLVNKKDLHKMMQLEITEYLPVSAEDYVFDYKVLGRMEEDNRSHLDLMVAAVNREAVDQYALLLEAAGLKPVVFDILPNVYFRLFGSLPYRDIMVLDGDGECTRVAIFNNNRLFMYADIPFSADVRPGGDFSALIAEVRGFLDYFSSRNFGKGVDDICILGELEKQAGVQETLSRGFAVSVTRGLALLEPLSLGGRAEDFPTEASTYAVNLGLMMKNPRGWSPGSFTVEGYSVGAPAGVSTGA